MDDQAYAEFIKFLDDMTVDEMSFVEADDKRAENKTKESMANMLKEALDEAKELSSYGESKIALENLLENLIEIGLFLSPEQIILADRAFGDSKNANDRISLKYYRDHLVR